METTTIRTCDDKLVAVDAKRLNAFDSFLRRDGDKIFGSDATEALSFMVPQLAWTEQVAFERKYTPTQAEQLLPISHAAGEWATTIRYEIMDMVGQGRRISPTGDDINLVDVGYSDKTYPIMLGGTGYAYTQEEIRQSSYLRRPLDASRAAAAIESYLRHMNRVGLNGEAESGLFGLFNHPLVPVGGSVALNWLVQTPANILKDINALIDAVWNATAFNDHVDTIVIAPSRFSHLQATPRSDNSDKTVLQYVKENNLLTTMTGRPLTIMPGFGLDTAGVGGVKRMIGYVKSDMRLKFHIPLPVRFLAPQFVNYRTQVLAEYKYSGVEFIYPKSAMYIDGI